MLGGSAATDASLGAITGRGFSADEVVGAVDRLVGYFKSARRPGERFLDAYRRLGPAPFKEVLYGDALSQ